MGKRYIMRARNYCGSYYDCEKQYDLLIPALIHFIKLRMKYDLVEFEYIK